MCVIVAVVCVRIVCVRVVCWGGGARFCTACSACPAYCRRARKHHCRIHMVHMLFRGSNSALHGSVPVHQNTIKHCNT